MMKRSSFLALAIGLLTSMALAAPSHAGTITVTGTWSVPGATAGELDFFFSAPVTDLVSFSGVPTPVTTFTPPADEVIFTYSPKVETGSLTFTVDTSGSFLGGAINVGSISGTPSANNFNFHAAAIPEPASIALLGIGMTGFLAFRRLFKRPSVA